MKSLKELIADEIALSERTLNVGEAEFILTVLKSIQEDTSKYEVRVLCGCRRSAASGITSWNIKRKKQKDVVWKISQENRNVSKW